MKRRTFLLALTAFAASLAVPLPRWLRAAQAAKLCRAQVGKPYPGPLRPLKTDEISRRGKWAG